MKKEENQESKELCRVDPDSLHTFLKWVVSQDLQPKIAEFVKTLIIEYDCQTSLERSLCEVIAISHGRLISTSKLMNEDFNLHYPSKEKIQYLSILSKELDRENRNYLTAINTLIEIKSPKMTINVNTENAFLSQNQQFNNNQWKNENIKD